MEARILEGAGAFQPTSPVERDRGAGAGRRPLPVGEEELTRRVACAWEPSDGCMPPECGAVSKISVNVHPRVSCEKRRSGI